ncbi:unnamed protein product [Taenia asiatica]|uniref:Uncharacterized protein n=1 Tax=Taenia asiatica TaxID=60517 RepID=A0A3P6RMH3_TAEAS|nr:unnamed protein product [Taenia asiatica]
MTQHIHHSGFGVTMSAIAGIAINTSGASGLGYICTTQTGGVTGASTQFRVFQFLNFVDTLCHCFCWLL